MVMTLDSAERERAPARLYSEAEYWNIVALPENGERRLELDEGVIEYGPSLLQSTPRLQVGWVFISTNLCCRMISAW